MPAKNPRRTDSYVPPPMGPVVHYEYKCKTNSQERQCIADNKGLIADWIFDTRYEQLKSSSAPLSEMELNELIAMGKQLTDLYGDEDLEMVKDILKEYKSWLKNPPREMIKDMMAKDIEILGEYYVVSAERHKLRRKLCSTYNSLTNLIERLKLETNKEKPRTLWTKENINIYLTSDKKFLDRIIKEKLFSREDIYGRIFEDDTIFKQLKQAFKEYSKKWKQHHGKSP